ncbi:hypothetical protein MIND_00469600 [Mycena indigotica]|uniref:Uncharacterized protein n=1 Tax=Mycena indigotica TaxID=2126181 RepID=A0A8H6W5Q4_9AGAR|nr:uncharacterized protein MIND_00469600 [Mycena indigotica]KAF7306779.1 hypothetical protein MIND_00469600 [Mycena indigotica]
MTIVHSAWRRLKSMSKYEKYSEADYAANVYNVFRSPAIRASTYKVQCNVSLPQPTQTAKLTAEAIRILGAKQATPDCLVLVPARSLRSLSNGMNSHFKVLSRHPTIANCGTASKLSSFRYQSTPLAVLPDAPTFQFVSSIWEDKKPVHHMLNDAYRQNRMATAGAARHLHSHHVHAPIFGLIWASGTVRAHVDWCSASKDDNNSPPVVYSAPYQKGGARESDSEDELFYEWQLERAGHIIEVFFLCEHIDEWTINGFKERIVRGVGELVERMRERRTVRGRGLVI